MDQNSPVTGNRALARKVALEQATKLSDSQAYEIWCAMQLIVNNKSLEGRPVAVVQMAMDFYAFRVTWKVIADKALEYEHLTSKRKR
jgi:hypothetical protein